MKISKAHQILEAAGKNLDGKSIQPIFENESGEKGLVVVIDSVHLGGLCGGTAEYISELYFVDTRENKVTPVRKVDYRGEQYKFCNKLDFT